MKLATKFAFIFALVIGSLLTVSGQSRPYEIRRPCPNSTSFGNLKVFTDGSIVITPCPGKTTTINGFSVGGSSVGTFANGTAAAPSITFTSDLDTGFYRVGANQLGVAAGGALVAEFTSTGITYIGSTSGTTAVQASATASGTLTLPAATDTLVGKATTDTLTNKTITNPAITVQALTDASTINWNAALGNIATVTIAGNRTLANPTNIKTGGSYALTITQSGGSNAITWGSAFKWNSGVPPTLTTTAGAVDMVTCISFDGTNLLCNSVLDLHA